MNRLLTVIVQSQDARGAEKALRKLNLEATELASTGAFLSRRNTTLIIGLAEEQVQAAIEAIHNTCKQRIEYISTPLESVPLPNPVATPVTVGGATVFTFEVEQYEEF